MSERDTNLYNELAESVLTAPIEDLEEEIRMEGGDPDKVAEEVREVLRNAIRAHPGHLIQRWYCSDCQCEHEASVIGGVVVPPLESPPLQSPREVESTRSEEEDYSDA